jgi:glycerol uptake facilitator-like aquaporin
VVGSGIMGERLSDGNVALALLGNTIATGAILAVLILVFGAVSGAHFNPAVTLAFRLRGEIGGAAAAAYVAVQIVGGLLGTWAAHIMFDEALFQLSNTARSGFPQWFAEFIAAFGLVATILGCLNYAVGLFITAGYWFTASTSFANPAVTIARSLTDTFSGIRPIDAPGFIVAQLLGAAAATLVFQWLLRPEDPAAVD